MRYPLMIALLAILSALGLACDPRATPTLNPIARATATPTLYEELLGVIPDLPETRASVQVNDYARVREVLDIATPGPEASPEELEEYQEATFLPGPWISGYHNDTDLSQNWPILGFDPRAIDQSIELEKGELEALRGRFDPQATQQGIQECGECPTHTLNEHQGVPFYHWRERSDLSFALSRKPPVFDALGRGGSLATQRE